MSTQKKNICVFCGASLGHSPSYTNAAQQLGQHIAQQGRRLVYGGGNKGLMGVIANSVLENGGEVYGVIPERLVEAETAHTQLTSQEVVPDMHTRKARMMALSDAFIALPGGIGTLEELFEVWTWGQIGYHKKPVGLLDVEGFYQPLLNHLQHSAEKGFMRAEYINTLYLESDPARLLQQFDQAVPHNLDRWAK